ncbi:hypothetical protein LINGRAPRIM_LOCUS2650, partial [Linum grandiflorum]
QNPFKDSALTQQLVLVYTPKIFKKWLKEYAATLSYGMESIYSEDVTIRAFNVFKREIDGTTTDERSVFLSMDGM